MNTSGISFTSASAQLAAMLVESEAVAAERTNQSLEATEQRIARAADEEYEQRMRAADASACAAFWGGAFTIAGGAATIGGGIQQGRALEASSVSNTTAGASHPAPAPTAGSELAHIGQLLSGLAPTAAKYGGEVEKERRDARAQRIGRSIEQASVEADQLSQQAQRQQQRANSGIEAARGFVDAESARSNAVLSKG